MNKDLLRELEATSKQVDEIMRDVLNDATTFLQCKNVLGEFCANNGYAIHQTVGYGWQVYTFNKDQIGKNGTVGKKLELFATYPDALRYVLNRINEDNQCE